VDQLFDSGEIKVARAMLLLADFDKDGKPKTVSSRVNLETLSEMPGTTRLQVRIFVDRFRKSGFVVRGWSGLHIHCSPPKLFIHELPRSNPAREDRGKR
jgi:CRP/FNR family cyclic AMP-dependent transcriptional regulator